MSAPDARYAGNSQQRFAGTVGAPMGGASEAATGQVRSQAAGRGVDGAAHPAEAAQYYAMPQAGQTGPVQGGYYGYPGYGQVPGAQPGQSGQMPGGAAGGQIPPAYGQPYAPGVYQMPATSQPQQLPKKKRKRVVIAIIVAIICIALAILLMLTMCDGASRRQGDAGQLAGKSDAEIQAELDRVVEEGMFNISIASVVEFESGTSEGDLRIENVPGNRYLMQVALVRNDTGEQIYQTDIIEPNHHIQRDSLDVDLPKGSYECTALFQALDPETEEQVGNAAAVITLNVLS